ncbi:carboxypeptidase-like regulatory domain-containing protein [Hymenobacter sp. BRD67]|uniref:carboxypeptidase-like regulatory domain-containing protein n=1 Tax=Hymenobacter sp. BRD67 TaxID=2675877 RepID=UPI001566CE08|nr:carboxypeptidase-like regulatory domain-containing protein [Hymenobacter sp. BRD67]QKG53313.1 carboxypeptidase regulatory-like domain-containing protein [Hymenobacter sp. BRD67]
MKLHYLRQTLLLALLLLTAQLGWSQGATTAAMSGTITDAKGQFLPGATVIAVHTPTNTQYVAPTNADGRFNIQNMRVGGPYTVKVTFVGFQDFTRTGINLTLAENFRLDAKLGESSTQLTEVTVTGRQNPVINADRTGAATTIQRQVIEQLPTINRSFSDYTRLTPQANGQGGFGSRNNLYNNITIDGALFNNSFGLSGTIGARLMLNLSRSMPSTRYR